MATHTEKIVLDVVMLDHLTNAAKRIKTTMQDMGNGMTKVVQKSIGKAADGVTNLNKTMVKTIPTVKKFKFEWLGVMFAGMALTRVFGGLIRAQMDLFGVSDMLSATWTLVLLPLMEMITPVIMRVLEAFMNMPEGVKLAIGIFVTLAAIVGTILMVVGQLFLGLGALATVFSSAAGGATGLAGVGKILASVFSFLSITFLAVAAVIIAVIIGMVLAWKSNFLMMKTIVSVFVDGIKQWFGGLIQFFKGIMQVISGILQGDFEKVGEGIKNILNGVMNFLIGLFKASFAAIGAVIVGSLKIAYNIIKVMVDAIGWIIGKAGSLFGGSGKSAFSLPSFQTGGVMPNDGLAYLHQGERVLTSGETRQDSSGGGGSANITVNASVSNDYDVRRLADKLKEYWVTDFEKTSQGRSI